MKVWIAYDDTEEALPIAMANSSTELAKITGVSENTIRSCARRIKFGFTDKERFAQVDIGEVD